MQSVYFADHKFHSCDKNLLSKIISIDVPQADIDNWSKDPQMDIVFSKILGVGRIRLKTQLSEVHLQFRHKWTQLFTYSIPENDLGTYQWRVGECFVIQNKRALGNG